MKFESLMQRQSPVLAAILIEAAEGHLHDTGFPMVADAEFSARLSDALLEWGFHHDPAAFGHVGEAAELLLRCVGTFKLIVPYHRRDNGIGGFDPVSAGVRLLDTSRCFVWPDADRLRALLDRASVREPWVCRAVSALDTLGALEGDGGWPSLYGIECPFCRRKVLNPAVGDGAFQAVRLSDGALGRAGFLDGPALGMAHRDCYLRAVGDLDAIVAD